MYWELNVMLKIMHFIYNSNILESLFYHYYFKITLWWKFSFLLVSNRNLIQKYLYNALRLNTRIPLNKSTLCYK